MRSRSDRLFLLSLLPPAATIVAAMMLMIYVFVYHSVPVLVREGLTFFASSRWSPSTSLRSAFYGILPAIYGTLVTSGIAVAIALPLSLSMTLFLNEVAPPRIRAFFSTLVDMMAGLPTIVYGLWGLFVLAPLLQRLVMEPLHRYLGFLPLFSCPPISGYSVLTAGVILAIMVMPYTFALMNEAYASIPLTYREAVLAMGASRYEASRILLSMIRPAIVGSVLLGLGRAASETVAVTLVIGNTPTISPCLFSSGYTIASLIATQYGEAPLYPFMVSALYGAGLFLLVLGLALNTVGLALVTRWRVRMGVSA